MPSKPYLSESNWYPPWAPRFWNGMNVSDYWNLLAENRFRIHPTKWPMTALVGATSVVNSTCSLFQSAMYGARIKATAVESPPIFVVGHWRSGTTLLHELMSLDPNLAFPTNFDAFVPQHMLVSRFLFYPFMNLLLPSRRPMDNMTLAAGSPQEDDFALCSLGAPTPYRRIAFPNRPEKLHEQLNGDNLTDEQASEIRNALMFFLQGLTLLYKKRLILKSPPHTGRIKLLSEWFPGAKFIHISRHPFKLVPSTMKLWRTLDHVQGFQVARYSDEWLKNYVFDCKDAMYGNYEAAREALPTSEFAELKFEDLLSDPEGEISKIYDQLELPNATRVAPAVTQYMQDRKKFSTNKHPEDPGLQQNIREHWQGYMQRFGYLDESNRLSSSRSC